MKQEVPLENGVQPLDAMMEELALKNSDVVRAGEGLQLSHKMISKGRKGRRLSPKVQAKITEAFNKASFEKDPEIHVNRNRKDLFNYGTAK